MARRTGLVLGLVALLAGAAAPDAGVGQPIDWRRLPSASQRLVEPVVARPQIARDVAHITYPSRREIWEYLLDYPDFAADVARALHEGKYRLRQVGDYYEADDGRGVTGIVRPLLVDGGRRIFYLEGRYDTRWFPTLRGRAVVVLDSEYVEPPGGQPLAQVRLVGYLRIDNVVVRAFMAIAQEFSERTFDGKVRKFFSHVERVSRRACDDPAGLLDLLAAEPRLSRERLAEFRGILLRHPFRRAADVG